MAKLIGKIIDDQTGHTVPARVNVTDATGTFVYPKGSILKVGPGESFFYSDGNFELEVPRGWTRLVVERGTEYVPVSMNLEVPSRGCVVNDISLSKWTLLGEQGWHPGNTHIHYDEKEKRPDERLRLDPRVEDLRMTAVSILKRWDLEYATNKYTLGFMDDFSSAHHYVECGEENRHNANGSHGVGYGHIMLLNIRNVIEPVSRGLLVDPFDPDYPPLSYACDDTRRQGGVVIWCHNGRGMEAPVAAILGKVDAFNLFDPHWMDIEYDIYYKMLDAGIRLPVSTGSDWFISSANRVYADTGGHFNYEDWLDALKAGRTFITNGPSLKFNVDGKKLGDEINIKKNQSILGSVTWHSHYSISKVEIILNGEIVGSKFFSNGSYSGTFETELKPDYDGWLVARVWSTERDSFAQPIFAHTSPIYIVTGLPCPRKSLAASYFNSQIENSLSWIGSKGKFYNDNQRREILDLYKEGQQIYKKLIK